MMKAKVVGALTLALCSAACVNPSARIASAVEGYGFRPNHAKCLGDRLEANLSLGQLQQLGRAARAAREGDTTPGRLSISDFLRVAGQVKDPKIPLEVTKAVAGCGIIEPSPAPLGLVP